jgi:hypothetical protein
MKNLLIISTLLLGCISVKAQITQDQQWLVGYSIDGKDPGQRTLMDFTTNQVGVELVRSDIDFISTNTSICDKDGKILLYTNGCAINDGQHRMIRGGDSINFPVKDWAPRFYSADCSSDSGYGTSDDHYFINFNQDSLIFLYHIRYTHYPKGNFYGANYERLYTKILKDAVGYKVVEKNVIVPMADSLFGGSAAVRVKGRANAWWIINGVLRQNKYYVTLVDSTGPVSTQSFTMPQTPHPVDAGFDFMVVSPDGKKIARRCRGPQLVIYDFDQETGAISNPVELYNPEIEDYYPNGVAFSANSRFLYACYEELLYQFDMESANPNNEKVLVAEWDGFRTDGIFRTIFFTSLLGPDCRIYINCPGGNRYLHTIMNPDVKGVGCEVRQRAIYTPDWYYGCLPAISHFRAGTAHLGPVCDPNIAVRQAWSPVGLFHTLSPNPASTLLTLQYDSEKPMQWVLFNPQGQQVQSLSLIAGRVTQELEVEQLPAGIYYYQLRSNGQPQAAGKVMIQH